MVALFRAAYWVNSTNRAPVPGHSALRSKGAYTALSAYGSFHCALRLHRAQQLFASQMWAIARHLPLNYWREAR